MYLQTCNSTMENGKVNLTMCFEFMKLDEYRPRVACPSIGIVNLLKEISKCSVLNDERRRYTPIKKQTH